MMDVEKMKIGYGCLFEIENELRCIINAILKDYYGVKWPEKINSIYSNKIANKKLGNLYFHELVSFISMIPILKKYFSKDLLNNLKKISPIRNKIAHCKLISDHELGLLNITYSMLRNNFTIC